MNARVVVFVVGIGVCVPGAAQVQFSQDAKGAVATARRTERPLMVFVRDRSSSCCGTSRWINKVLSDPGVVAAAREFVCLEVAPNAEREALARWQLHPGVRMAIVFSADDGTLLARANGLAAQTVVNAARQALQQYDAHVWKSRLAPALTAESTKPAAQHAALRGVQRRRILAADEAVVSLLERSALPRDIRQAAYETLATLATPAAVAALLDHAATDPHARKALENAGPDAVSALLTHLDGPNEQQHLLAYRALVRILKLSAPKPDAFWAEADLRARAAELRRVRDAAGSQAAAVRARRS